MLNSKGLKTKIGKKSTKQVELSLKSKISHHIKTKSLARQRLVAISIAPILNINTESLLHVSKARS
jgi:hypothetical protein